MLPLHTCGTCQHWRESGNRVNVRHDDGETSYAHGHCWREPPKFIGIGMSQPSVLGGQPMQIPVFQCPDVTENRGCGEHSDYHKPEPLRRDLSTGEFSRTPSMREAMAVATIPELPSK